MNNKTYKALERRCIGCNRLLHRYFIELDGAEWELKENYATLNTFMEKCWPCSCNQEEANFEGEPAVSRHISIINFMSEKGCGCG